MHTSTSIIVSGSDLTVCESLFKKAAASANTMVILDFNSERTLMSDYLNCTGREISTELPHTGFSVNAVCNTYNSICEDELMFHHVREALSLLEEVSLAFDKTPLTLERYKQLSEPSGFDACMDNLSSRTPESLIMANQYRARYSRCAHYCNDVDSILEISSATPTIDENCIYYFKCKKVEIENRIMIRQIIQATGSFNSPFTLIINEGMVNHSADVFELCEKCADSGNISMFYFTRNAFASKEGENLLSLFETKIFTQNDLPSAQRLSAYLGEHDVREKRRSITKDERFGAYSLPDRIFGRDKTTTTTTEIRRKAYIEPERIVRLQPGVCVAVTTAGIRICNLKGVLNDECYLHNSNLCG